jgi:uncharacterized protein YdeI (YjbR/CyaY-like superfamily)
MAPTYFSSPAAFRAWLAKHHASHTELLVGFHKTSTETPSMTWTESVREALCFGWIDGVRKSVDDARYTIRFTPRKAVSIWSSRNVQHVQELIAAGLMQPAGLAAFEARKAHKVAVYSFEQGGVELPESYTKTFRKQRKAFAWFNTQPPSYRTPAIWWVVSAKQEVTRERRLATLIECSANEERLPQLRPAPRKTGRKAPAKKRS